MNRLLDLREWLEKLRMDACRYPGQFPEGSADFAQEAIELVENNCTDEYWELAEALHKDTNEQFPEDEPEKAIEWLLDRAQLLDEVEDILDQSQNRTEKDIANCVTLLIEQIEELETELAALKAPAVVLPDGTPLEFDL